MRPILIAMASVVCVAQDPARESWSAAIAAATKHRETGEFREALATFEKAASIARGAKAAWPLLEPATASHLSALSLDMGRTPQAERHCLAGLRALEPRTGPTEDIIRVHLLQACAWARYHLGNTSEARESAQQALSLIRPSAAEQPLKLANTLVTLGSILALTGELEGGRSAFEEAVSIHASLPPADYPTLALALEGQAFVAAAGGHFAEAEPLYNRAVSLLQRSFGSNHPALSGCLRSHAATLRRLRRGSEAKKLEARAAEIEAKAGPNWSGAAVSIHGLRPPSRRER